MAQPPAPRYSAEAFERRFAEFDLANPQVWHLFEIFALERISQGFSRYSADAILHRVRWETATAKVNAQGFRINDHFSAFYARKFVAAHPQWASFFELRTSKADLRGKAA